MRRCHLAAVPCRDATPDRFGGCRSVNGIMSKIARLAVSKAAAFGYAVAVGVAGNIAFNFVERHQPPVIAAAPAAIPAPARTTAAAIASVPPAAPLSEPRQPPAPPAVAAIPASPPAATTALPEPPTVALPTPDTLPTPALRAAALPASPVEAAPRPPAEEASRPMPQRTPTETQPSVTAPPPAGVAPEQALRPTPLPAPVAAASAATNPPAALPPLGPPVEVASPPAPPASPARAAPVVAMAAQPPTAPRASATHAAAASANPDGWRLSDLWHPVRVVRKGLDWAGDQLPSSGDSAALPPPFPVTTPLAGPIPLVPASGKKADFVATPKSAAPGPGSGGLY
jgi:hypothetical protein